LKTFLQGTGSELVRNLAVRQLDCQRIRLERHRLSRDTATNLRSHQDNFFVDAYCLSSSMHGTLHVPESGPFSHQYYLFSKTLKPHMIQSTQCLAGVSRILIHWGCSGQAEVFFVRERIRHKPELQPDHSYTQA
jgi:hypothetical protein